MNNFVSAILLLVSFGLFFAYINPTYRAETGALDVKARSVGELRRSHERYDEALLKVREIEEVRKGLLQVYSAIPAENLERLETLLPDHIDSVRFIIDISAIAAGHGLLLKNVSLEGGDASAGGRGGTEAGGTIGPKQTLYQPSGVKFTVSGSYDNFRSFLNDLEQSLRLADATAISFTAADYETYDFSVTVDTYRLE